MIIKVTNDHIAEGDQGDENSCAVALAVKEQVPGVDPETVRVQGCSILFNVGDAAYDIRTPDEIAEWIEAFDAGGIEVEVELDEVDEDGELITGYELEDVGPIDFELDYSPANPCTP